MHIPVHILRTLVLQRIMKKIMKNITTLRIADIYILFLDVGDDTSANRTEETLLTEETSSSGIASKNTSSQNRTATSSSSGGPLQTTPPGEQFESTLNVKNDHLGNS